MKKQLGKKLRLSRETIRVLDAAELRTVAGGIPTPSESCPTVPCTRAAYTMSCPTAGCGGGGGSGGGGSPGTSAQCVREN